MPCIGPQLPSNELVKQITQEVLELLADKNNWNREYDICHPLYTIANARQRTIQLLEEAIKECIFQYYCENF